jgi:hypothetical protein
MLQAHPSRRHITYLPEVLGKAIAAGTERRRAELFKTELAARRLLHQAA